MKTIKRLGVAGVLAGALAIGGCSTTNGMLGRNQQTWTMQPQGPAPAAEGKIQVATGEKGNRDLKVEVKHLAPATATFEGTSTYVVWLKPEDGQAVNIGVLNPNKDQEAELKTKTPYTSFEILVTAEPTAQPTAPSGREVMTASVQVAT
jgi:FlaG/FlaF family flagellin (archaellin)